MKNKRILCHCGIKHLFILVISFTLSCGSNVGAMSGYSYNLPNIRLSFRKKVKKVFTPEEDERLKELVEEYGTSDLKLIANNMEGRNMRQCKERWGYYLSPNVKKDGFTQEEDEIILKKQEEYGNKWGLIAVNYLPGRTDIQVGNRFTLLQRRCKGKHAYKNKQKTQMQTTITQMAIDSSSTINSNLPRTTNLILSNSQQSNTVEANKDNDSYEDYHSDSNPNKNDNSTSFFDSFNNDILDFDELNRLYD